jgi:hypothetical protein
MHSSHAPSHAPSHTLLSCTLSCTPLIGAFEANPPFVPLLIEHMVTHMEELLAHATEALMFIVVIPVSGLLIESIDSLDQYR